MDLELRWFSDSLAIVVLGISHKRPTVLCDHCAWLQTRCESILGTKCGSEDGFSGLLATHWGSIDSAAPKVCMNHATWSIPNRWPLCRGSDLQSSKKKRSMDEVYCFIMASLFVFLAAETL